MMYLGVIGDPGKRSLSPVFQQAAIDALGLDITYERWATPPEALVTRVEGLRAPSVLGANVTIPHKQAVIPLLDELDPLAGKVGAVNTIMNRDGRLHGYNTDVEGFLRGLRDDATFEPAGKRALIAGAGGAARAVVVALATAGARSIVIINRTFPRASRLVEELAPLAGDTELHALPDIYPSWAEAMRRADLLVNCTPAGQAAAGDAADAGRPVWEESPVPFDEIRPGILVYDLVYVPAETPLIKAAKTAGAAAFGGLPMLIYQGAASLKIWTGREAPVDVMLRAARAALGLGTA
ncbi:MAG TPA: shikimate dehydrogenase [Dehalococcoidia bacterium]|nr:shikimate dehydrogenase [Dehalococcoidia bacterium]